MNPRNQKSNNIDYVDFDEKKSYIIDNKGDKLSFDQKILLSFDIKYPKNQETGQHPVHVIKDEDTSRDINRIQRIAKKGDKYYLFYSENIRIDKL
ncbi:hypothetical protein [Paenimyroides aestuarii]|uniref:Uncharacterized protein n=1 Tax=Paenimyroides aestuarii TaxID=2968490 RepID=A0ABY5NV24_9FLAO|nr:hypothetical protein [Paenimyroides aestuarii]UUV22307.1 hypothetical protein NPX36_04530 [Paenimyroides aestuarii]